MGKEGIEEPKTKKETVVRVENKEDEELEFNFEQIKNHWIDFYKSHNLEKSAEEIEKTEINLSDEQIAKFKEKAKEGFDCFLLMPSIQTQKMELKDIERETGKEMKGLVEDKTQYSEEGTWLSENMESYFSMGKLTSINVESEYKSDKISNSRRPRDKAYALFIKDTPEIEDNTINKSAETLRKEFQEKQETGLTFSEYLVFQRDFTQRHIDKDQPHPDAKYHTWLLDTECPIPRISVHKEIPEAHWYSPKYQQVRIGAFKDSDSSRLRGARSSVLFEL